MRTLESKFGKLLCALPVTHTVLRLSVGKSKPLTELESFVSIQLELQGRNDSLGSKFDFATEIFQ